MHDRQARNQQSGGLDSLFEFPIRFTSFIGEVIHSSDHRIHGPAGLAGVAETLLDAILKGPIVNILLANDDGVFAPGIRALRQELSRLGKVTIVAPHQEQSGVGHSITILEPLIAKLVDDADGTPLGWSVEGSPADCIKLAVHELLDEPPDLIVSGINAGANAGINVLYSGTVAAAIEGAFFGITSIAVSLEFAEHFDYPRAAHMGVDVIKQILSNHPPKGSLFNVNLPSHLRGKPKGIKVVPMGVGRYGEGFEKRQDPRGRSYYWMTYAPPYNIDGPETDVSCLSDNYITVTPLKFDLTRHEHLEQVSDWNLSIKRDEP